MRSGADIAFSSGLAPLAAKARERAAWRAGAGPPSKALCTNGATDLATAASAGSGSSGIAIRRKRPQMTKAEAATMSASTLGDKDGVATKVTSLAAVNVVNSIAV